MEKFKQIADRCFKKYGYEIFESLISDDSYSNKVNQYNYRCDIRKGYVRRQLLIPFSTKKEIKEKIKDIVKVLNVDVENKINTVMEEFEAFNNSYMIGVVGFIIRGFVDLRSENKTIYFRMHLFSYDNYQIGSRKHYESYDIKLHETEIENLRSEMYKYFNNFYNSEIERSVHR